MENQLRHIQFVADQIKNELAIVKGLKGGNSLNSKGVCLRKDGRWQATKTVNGVRKYCYANSRSEALKLYKELCKQDFKKSTQIAFKDALDVYLNKFKVGIKESTKINQTGILKRNLAKLMDMNVSTIKIDLLQDVVNEASPSQRSIICGEIKAMYKVFLALNYVKRNDTDLLTFSKEEVKDNTKIDNKKEVILSKDEIQKLKKEIIKSVKDKKCINEYCDFIDFSVFTGLRIGETLALNVGDIDYEKKIIIVNKQYNNITKKITPPKSVTSIRNVPLFDCCISMLQKRTDNKETSDLLFDLKYEATSILLHRYLKKINNSAKIHSFRKTFASNCINNGISLKVIQQWLGHSSSQITDEVYTFASEESMDNAFEKMNQILK